MQDVESVQLSKKQKSAVYDLKNYRSRRGIRVQLCSPAIRKVNETFQ